MRHVVTATVVALLAAASAASSGSALAAPASDAAPPAHPPLTLFSELDEAQVGTFFANKTLISLMQRIGGVTVSLAIRDLSDTRAAVVRQMHAAGVPVVAWLLLPRDEGYWFNLDNAVNSTSQYDAFRAWQQQQNLTFAGVGFDLEIDRRNVDEIAARQWGKLLASLLGRLSQSTYNATHAAYEALAQRARADESGGGRLESYILPFVYDERMIKDSTILQRFSGIVDVGQSAVDIEIPMLYTTEFPLGLGMMGSYAGSSHGVAGVGDPLGAGVANGGLAAIGLGSTGSPAAAGDNQTYVNASQFVDDILWATHALAPQCRDFRSVAAQPCGGLYVYSLEGAASRGYLDVLAAPSFDWTASPSAGMQQLLAQQEADWATIRALLRDVLKIFAPHTAEADEAELWAALTIDERARVSSALEQAQQLLDVPRA